MRVRLNQYFILVKAPYDEAQWESVVKSAEAIPVFRFEGHTQLQTYMENLAYQKGLVDPFERLTLEDETIRTQWLAHPLSELPGFTLSAVQGLTKGRLHNEWVPLDREDLAELKTFASLGREHQPMPTLVHDLFQTTSTAKQWLETDVLLDHLMNEFPWDQGTLAYLCEW